MGKALDFYDKNRNTISKIVYCIAAALVSSGLNIFVASRAVIGIEAETISAEVGFIMILVTAAICVIASAFIYRKVFAQEVETGEIAEPDPVLQEFRPDPASKLNDGLENTRKLDNKIKLKLKNDLDEISKKIDIINDLEGVLQVSHTNAPTQQQSLFGVDNKIISDSNKNRILEAVTAGDRYKKLGEIQDNILKGYKEKLDELNGYEPGANRENFSESMNKVSVNVHEMINKAMALARKFKAQGKTHKARVPNRGLARRSANAANAAGNLTVQKQKEGNSNIAAPAPASLLDGNKAPKIKTTEAKETRKHKSNDGLWQAAGELFSNALNGFR